MRDPSYPFADPKSTMETMQKLSRTSLGLRYHGFKSRGRTEATLSPAAFRAATFPAIMVSEPREGRSEDLEQESSEQLTVV